MPTLTDGSKRALVALLLAAAVLAVFWPVLGNGFLVYDDEKYVTQNRHVQAGLTADGIRWACTTFHAANWHPLTWISHMLDRELYGDRPAGHHFTSLLLHLANTVLLFLLLERMTGATRNSAIVAALFALHPLHVESVAWVAERKDVLSTFFWLLAIGSYARYVRRPGPRRYLLVALFLALGLTSKPMAVTAPFTLLLLDYWPLGRLRAPGSDGRLGLGRLVAEKIPLFALSAVSSVLTLFAQRAGDAVASTDAVPASIRLANATVSYASYLAKTVWPAGLAVHYPHMLGDVPVWKVTVSAAVLVVVTLAVLRAARGRAYLAFGWLWYLGTLVPVIGLVQVGSQAMADRYTYVPLVGIFVILVWGASDAARGAAGSASFPHGSARRRFGRLAAPAAWGAILVALAVGTWHQLGYWRNTVTLFERALAVTEPSAKAHNVLGLALVGEGRHAEAVEQFRHALAIRPRYAEAHNNLGGALAAQGLVEEGMLEYRKALRIAPNYVEAHNNLGVAMARRLRTEEAITHFKAAVDARPDYAKAHGNLAAAYAASGDYAAAWSEIALARRYGLEPPAALVDRLSAKMPEPVAP